MAVVFFSEIHYDNVGVDENEGFEVTGPSGYDLSAWAVLLYRADGTIYTTVNIPSGTVIPNQLNCWGTYSRPTVLQNGPNQGLALVNSVGVVVDFVSYEGTLVATTGSAKNLISHDISVNETNSALNSSLQAYSSIYLNDTKSWRPFVPTSFGFINTGLDVYCGPGPSAVPTPGMLYVFFRSVQFCSVLNF